MKKILILGLLCFSVVTFAQTVRQHGNLEIYKNLTVKGNAAVTGTLTTTAGWTNAGVLTADTLFYANDSAIFQDVTIHNGAVKNNAAVTNATTTVHTGKVTNSDSVSFANRLIFTGRLTLIDSTVTVPVVNKNVVVVNDSQNNAINGFSGGVAGQVIYLVNVGATNIVLKHNGSGTQKMLIAADLTITAAGGAIFYCDGTSWYLVSIAQ